MGRPPGFKHTEETKNKMREKAMGHIVSEETRDKISKKLEGHRPSKETREKLRIARRKRIITEETKEKYKKTIREKGGVWNKGLKDYLSEDSRKKMSERSKGNKNSLGYRHTEETRKKMSKAHKDVPLSEKNKQGISKAMIGNKNAFIDGSSYIPYSKEYSKIRKVILERDDYTCQHCGEKAIDVHHIDRNKENNDPMNLISLCKICHNLTKIKRKLDYWQLYYTELMSLRFPKYFPKYDIMKGEQYG